VEHWTLRDGEILLLLIRTVRENCLDTGIHLLHRQYISTAGLAREASSDGLPGGGNKSGAREWLCGDAGRPGLWPVTGSDRHLHALELRYSQQLIM